VREASEAELPDAEKADRIDAENAVGPLDAELADIIYKECQRRLG